MSPGTGIPARSSAVGALSMLTTQSLLTVPGLTTPGYRIIQGTRIDCSYMNRLSNQPWSPMKNPWSPVKTTIVLSARWFWSRKSSRRPTLSSWDLNVPRKCRMNCW